MSLLKIIALSHILFMQRRIKISNILLFIAVVILIILAVLYIVTVYCNYTRNIEQCISVLGIF